MSSEENTAAGLKDVITRTIMDKIFSEEKIDQIRKIIFKDCDNEEEICDFFMKKAREANFLQNFFSPN